MMIASQYKPSDFSEGLWHEALVTLGKNGFSPEMASEVANAKSGKAIEVVGLFGDVEDAIATRAISVPEGMTPSKAFALCKTLFQCYSYYGDDLDGVVVVSDRNSTSSYTIRVYDRVEADEELKNLSAETLKERGIVCETLTERLLHEMVYFLETGKHLDTATWTLCAGSRYSDGFVPRVRWGGGEFYVDGYRPQYSSPYLRARLVVS